MRRALFAVVLLGLVVAGCRIETNIGLALEADGSGIASIDIGMDDEAMAFMETTGQTFEDACSTEGLGDLVGENPLEGVIGADPDQEATAEVVREDDLTICRTSFGFDDIESLADDADADGLDLDVSISDDEVRVAGTLAGDSAGGDESLDELGFDLGALEDVFAVNLRITMPGEVIESNADRTLSDGTLEWNVDLFGGGDVVVEAVSDPTGGGGGGSTTLLIVLAAAALAAVALFFFLRSRRSPAPAAVEAPAAAPPEMPETPDFGPEGTEG